MVCACMQFYSSVSGSWFFMLVCMVLDARGPGREGIMTPFLSNYGEISKEENMIF